MIIVVMFENAKIRIVVHAMFLGQLRTDFGVRARNLMGQRLAYVVEQAAKGGDFYVGPTSAASIPESRATSIECLSTFSP